jgi:SAM-dependent methyltransferase
MLRHLPAGGRVVDIGCGWGQFLALAGAAGRELYGLDESRDRVAPVREAAPEARIVIGRADRPAFRTGRFDGVTASQVLHEVRLFGDPGEFHRALVEVRRLLRPGGVFLLLDHQDAGDGEVRVRFPPEAEAKLARFEARFEFRAAAHREGRDGTVVLARRDLQDFLTKDWSMDSPMESIEMKETHNVFEEWATRKAFERAGLTVKAWIEFAPIDRDLEGHGAQRLGGEPWFRKFLAVAESRPLD